MIQAHYTYCLFIWPCCVACGILVPTRIKPLHWELRVLTTGLPGNLFISLLLPCGRFPWWLRQNRICLQWKRSEFHPWVWKSPWRRKWQPPPVSSILAWEIPWTEEPSGLQSMGSQTVRHE